MSSHVGRFGLDPQDLLGSVDIGLTIESFAKIDLTSARLLMDKSFVPVGRERAEKPPQDPHPGEALRCRAGWTPPVIPTILMAAPFVRKWPKGWQTTGTADVTRPNWN